MGQTSITVRRDVLFALLAALCAPDAVFIVLHLAHAASITGYADWPALANPRFSLAADGGYGERWEYLKSALTVAILALIAWRTQQQIYGALAIAHGWLLADNALQAHELLGARFGQAWTPAGGLGLDAAHLGELMLFLLAGLLISALLAGAFLRTQPEGRKGGLLMTGALALLAVFAVGFDAVALPLTAAGAPISLLNAFEDGGETMLLSLNTALAGSVLATAPQRRASPERA